MNFQTEVTKAFKDIEASGFIQKQIEESLKKSIQDIIESQLRSFSPFGEKVKDYIKKCLDIDLEKSMTLPTYNTYITSFIKEEVEKIMHEQGKESLVESIKLLLTGDAKDYSLSEIMNIFREENEEEAQEEAWNEFSFHFDKDESFIHIHFDKEPDKSKYNCAYQIDIYKGKIYNMLFGSEYGKYSFKIKDDKVLSCKIGNFDKIEKILFNIYSRGYMIQMDEDKVETEYTYEDY